MFAPLTISVSRFTAKMKFKNSAAQALLCLVIGLFIAAASNYPAAAQTTISDDWQTRGYYAVANLSPGDTLNVRAGASSKSPVVDELAQGTLVFATGKIGRSTSAPWFQINHSDGEGVAWVSSKYLQAAQVKHLAQTRAPQAGTCSGFEPGWEVSWTQAEMKASTMTGPLGRAQFSSAFTPGGVPTPSVIEYKNIPAALRFTLVLEDRICTALPTDSAHYQSGLLLVEKDGTLSAYSGCCNPAPEAIGTGG